MPTSSRLSNPQTLLDYEDEGSIILSNVSNYCHSIRHNVADDLNLQGNYSLKNSGSSYVLLK